MPLDHPFSMVADDDEDDDDDDELGGWKSNFLPHTSHELWNSRIEEVKQTAISQTTNTFIETTLKRRAERVLVNQKHANAIQLWYRIYRTHLGEVHDCLVGSAMVLATSQGLPLLDMMETEVYKRTFVKAMRLQMVEMVSLLRSQISVLKLQTLKYQANRISESKKCAQKTRRKEIEAFYNKFEFEDGVKPSLDTFRGFPILRTLQRGIAATGTKCKCPTLKITSL